MPRKTTQRPDLFSELDSRQFEDLVRQLAPRVYPFRKPLTEVGRLGSDEGRDAAATEVLKKGRKTIERPWLLQMKRYQRITPKQLEAIVEAAVPDPTNPPHGLLVATSADVSPLARKRYAAAASARGVTDSVIWDRSQLVDMLLDPGNHDLNRLYIGTERAVDGTQLVPLGLEGRPSLDLPVVGRDDELVELLATSADVILVGEPGSGKTRLALEMSNTRFAWLDADAEALADSIRRHQPNRVVVDDAGLPPRRRQIEMLRELRRVGHKFQIVATLWPNDREAVAALLPGAAVVVVERLERPLMDQIVQGLGVTNEVWRHIILDQAHGRPGWAETLAELAKNGQGTDAASGRGLVRQIGRYLERVGVRELPTTSFLSHLALLGEVRFEEMDKFGPFCGLGRADWEELLVQAAAAGLLEQTATGWRVSPEALRYALAEHWFFTRTGADPGAIARIAAEWPTHLREIRIAVIRAAHAGSAEARRRIEGLITSVTELDDRERSGYLALDRNAVRRALDDTADLEPSDFYRRQALKIAAEDHQLPDAIRGLLDEAVGDERPLYNNTDHPARILGEIGSTIGPLGTTDFPHRIEVFRVANAWLDEDPSVERARAWAKVVGRLLEPSVSGTRTDPADPHKITWSEGSDSAQNMQIIVDEMWPEVAIRLRHLDSRGLVPIIDLVDHWIRLSKDGWGLRSTPNKLQHRVAKRFIKTLVPSVVDATRDHPGAQVRLRDLTDRTKLRIAHPTLDPEFAFLMVNDLRRPRDGEKGFVEHRVHESAEHWAEEDPATLTERIGRWSEEARLVERDLHPGLPWVVRAMLERIEGVERIDGLVVGGLDAGLTYELADLMAASVQRSADLPPWFERALSSPARRQAVAAGIQQDGNRPAALAALAALDDRDVADLAYLVPMKDPDWVTLELLKHANDNIRGTAALQFSFGPRDRSPEVPADWRQTWSDAFEVAPLESRRTHDGWRLGEHLRRLVDEGPELVERWLTRQIAADPLRAFLSLPSGFEPALERLPEESRLRLMERFAKEYVGSELLGKLLGSDSPFLGRLLDEGTVELEDAVTALRYIQGTDEEPRIDRVLKHAPILLRRGVQPEDIAYATVMSSGVYTGPESGHWDRWRAEFESRLATADPEVRPVIEAGLRVSIAERDHALKEERQKRIAGRL